MGYYSSQLQVIDGRAVLILAAMQRGSAVACARVLPDATCAWLHGVYNCFCVIDGRTVMMHSVLLVYIRTGVLAFLVLAFAAADLV